MRYCDLAVAQGLLAVRTHVDVCGGGVLLRSDYLDDVGLFDEDFFLYYEDTDLAGIVCNQPIHPRQ